jgi:transposase
MVLALSAEQKQAAVAAVLAGEDVEVVAKRTRIALAELARLCLAQRPDRRTRREQQRRGRKPKLGDPELAVLQAIVEEKRRLTQQELAAELAARTGKTVSVPTIAKGMKELGYQKVNLQKAKSVPAPQSPPRYTDQHRRQRTRSGARSPASTRTRPRGSWTARRSSPRKKGALRR